MTAKTSKIYTGTPCKHGHTERYESNGKCVPCQRKAGRDWYRNMNAERREAYLARQKIHDSKREQSIAVPKPHGPELIRVSVPGWGVAI